MASTYCHKNQTMYKYLYMSVWQKSVMTYIKSTALSKKSKQFSVINIFWISALFISIMKVELHEQQL